MRNLVENNDFSQAQTLLTDYITEHDNFYPDLETDRNFNWGDNQIMKFCDFILGIVIEKNNPIFIDGDLEGNPTIHNLSEIVTQFIETETQPNYPVEDE